MSGASRACCRVCGSTNLKVERDHGEGVLLEETQDCPDCKLYRSEYAYGNSSTWHGFVRIDATWTPEEQESVADYWVRLRALDAAEKETRAMWNDPRCRPFLDRIRENPADAAPALVFADFLEETGLYPGQAAGIREQYEREGAST